MNHTGATQTTGVGAYAGPVATVAAYSSGDSLSSRLIASRTSAPPSVAFAPWGEVRETVCPRNINNEVLPQAFSWSKMVAIPERKSCRNVYIERRWYGLGAAPFLG